MYEIQANAKGSRQIKVTDAHLNTIEKYGLFQQLVGSNGIVDEMILEKLRLNVRALIEVHPASNELIDLSREVIFHDNMKAFGLERLIALYAEWQTERQEKSQEMESTD